ncbi:NADH dehydrogenase subunit 5 [Ornithinibacillus salinisoli]|uniref:Probable inorganic carbon transporter subunit DabB n=1 Tax=Ornithinibacillus salinisoli TaxID=1848459 RepID=A0ABW4W1Z1_9BACI
MINLMNLNMEIAFFFSLIISLLSSLLFLHPRVPIGFVRIHIMICAIPPIIALLNIVISNGGDFGPWYLDSLAWLMTLFVLTIGFIIQRYSVRYLLGDRAYRKYFSLFTLTTGAAAVSWLSNDVRLLVLCWGVTLFGLTLLIRVNKKWQLTKIASDRSGRLFAISWIALLVAVLWLSQITGQWQLSHALSNSNLDKVNSWEGTGIILLLVLSVMIPAAQWPFHRWLIESMVAPTPVSAVMHAGLVNAGGILLTRFAPLFDGGIAQILLLILASISVLLGTGMILVQVDYKRQLVASTISQMGFMLIQCALGAYLAAIIHLIMHGLFKGALFLQAGSAVPHASSPKGITRWSFTSSIMGILVGLVFWLYAPGDGYQLISALILGTSFSLSWTHLVAFGDGWIGRMTGFILLGAMLMVYITVHSFFYELMYETISYGIQPPLIVVVPIICLLLFTCLLVAWIARNRSSVTFMIIYLWLIKLGEPKPDLVESHPTYLAQLLSQGGNKG